MVVLKTTAALQEYLALKQGNDRSIGFVPTMGALHDGHIALVKEAKAGTMVTVCSIFVNPTQFNDAADFARYPVTIEKDIYLLEQAGCDVLFLPSVSEIYPEGLENPPHYDLGNLERILEGEFRPGHFQGVCRVVDRLLSIVQPTDLYMGQKDYQQCMVIQRLLELTGKEKETRLRISGTRRENSGLAMSSRNMRLTDSEKIKAAEIYRSLSTIREQLNTTDTSLLLKNSVDKLRKEGFKVDYVEIADAVSLSPVRKWNGTQKLVALAAVFLGDVRLIDNLLLN
jgi:pantoate--beta-alanine ligase